MTKSSLSQKLREAIGTLSSSIDSEKEYRAYADLKALLPGLLTEHEALQRKADAGATLAEWLNEKDNIYGESGDDPNIGPNVTWRKKRDAALSAYREATKPSDV